MQGCNFIANRAEKFSPAMEFCDLIDLGAKGNWFTWFRRVEGQRTDFKRLDRAMADVN